MDLHQNARLTSRCREALARLPPFGISKGRPLSRAFARQGRDFDVNE